jgi:hypothetical protein
VTANLSTSASLAGQTLTTVVGLALRQLLGGPLTAPTGAGHTHQSSDQRFSIPSAVQLQQTLDVHVPQPSREREEIVETWPWLPQNSPPTH